MIDLENITTGYRKTPVLRDLTLTFPEGKITSVIGTNGCGKSTLLKAVVRLLPLTAGRITVDGIPLESHKPDELAKKIAYLPQNHAIPDMTVRQMVLHGRFAYLTYPRVYRAEDRAAAERAMRTVGITDLAERPVCELSGGMRQKAYIAMALAQGSPTILMDEPTTYLDAAHQLQFAETARSLAANGHTLVLVLHDLPFALKLSDNLAVLHGGRVLATGTPEEILQSGAVETAYHVKIHPVNTNNRVDYTVSL